MERYQEKQILVDLNKKMVILSGPRQVGKTTLAKSISTTFNKCYYLNYDSIEDKRVFLEKSWDRRNDIVIFDEIHKHKKWKNHIKGVYDKEGISPRILITGSARLDFQRKSGDSLVGRYFRHRLYPLTVGELKKSMRSFRQA